jgi:hypothetical protein
LMSRVILAIAVLLLIWGCGSESNQGTPGSKAGKKPLKESSLTPKKAVKPPEGLTPLLGENSKLVEISPPIKPGGFGITADQQQPNTIPKDPALLPVAPPIKPGERVPTAAEVEARLAEQAPPDPNTTLVSPPLHPGEKGPTVAEFYKSRAKDPWGGKNPEDFQLGPPIKPGEKGMTVSEFKAFREKNPVPNMDQVPPLPIGVTTTGSSKK